MKVDIAIPGTRMDVFTYTTKEDLHPGDLVIVPIRKKLKHGIVVNRNSQREVPSIREIHELVQRDFMPQHMLTLYKWIAEYYFATLSDVLRMAMPSKIMKKYELPAQRIQEPVKPTALRPNAHQNAAIREIVQALESHSYAAFLLHGITGSGKTEVYLRSVDHVIRSGGRALVLVPEIAQTPLLFERFEERFRGQVATIHSTLTDKERRQIWHAIKDGVYRVVIGPRSTIFVPIPDLKIVIVDEEHDQSYKEHTRMPRYNARDVAVARSRFENCVTVLGSATPQLESYHNTTIGKYRLLDLKERIDSRPLPRTEIIDLREESRPFISPKLQAQVEATLRNGEQAIVFLNRRGFAPSLMCPYCGFTARCPFCKLPLVYHKAERDEPAALSCHVCSHRSAVRTTCPKCGRATLLYRGAGTQRVEELLKKIVQGIETQTDASTVVRLDRDSARPRGSIEQILGTFQDGTAKILLGTQLVTKGFDFQDVTLVGIINADTILHLPDFRSGERTFQVLTQVAGRSGRGEKPGKVLIQTYHPEQYASIFGQLQDYATFYESELRAREELGFPPFSRLLLVRFKGTNETDVWSEAKKLHKDIKNKGGLEIYGPNESFYYKIRDNYRVFLLIKLKKTQSTRKIDFLRIYRPAKCDMEIDVDPLEVF